MKPTENTENVVRRGKVKVTTDPQMDRSVLDDSFAAMDETIGTGSSRPGWIPMAARLAAAAVILITIGLLAIQPSPPEQEPAQVPNIARSPAEMFSVMSLSMAYRRGGIEAVDDLSGKAFEMLGSQPAKVSVRQLLAEFNGV